MKKLGVLLIILIIIGGGIWFFRNDILNIYSGKLPEFKKEIGNLTQKIEEQISMPAPLISEEEASRSFLTSTGIIKWTNAQREKYNLSPLEENPKLDSTAAIKAEDMFKNQYFAHESPNSVGVGDLARDMGYESIIIGENLAMGNFKDDEALVQAWMDSPGHRANILNPKYTEIGVAANKGQYEGRTVWMAVQHFGYPLSSCSQPSPTLKEQIESNESRIKQLQNNITTLEAEIRSMKPRPRDLYNQKIDQYNNLVNQYNNLIEETKKLLNQYNNQVNAFNECIGAGG